MGVIGSDVTKLLLKDHPCVTLVFFTDFLHPLPPYTQNSFLGTHWINIILRK